MGLLQVSAIIYLCCQLILCISAIFFNGLYLIALVKKRSLRTPSNTILGCLCCSDLLIGILTLPLWAYNVLLYANNAVYLNFQKRIVFSMGFLVFMSLSSIFMILVNLDRYAAICHPFKYLQYATSRLYAVISTCSCFFYLTAITTALVLDNIFNTFSAAVIVMIVVCSALITFLYCTWKIIKVIHKHRREIATSSRQHSGLQSETIRHRIVTVLTVVFVFFKVPSFIPYVLFVIGKVEVTGAMLMFGMFSSLLLPLNSLVNPLIYYFRIEVLRNAMVDLLCVQRRV